VIRWTGVIKRDDDELQMLVFQYEARMRKAHHDERTIATQREEERLRGGKRARDLVDVIVNGRGLAV
jgi:hypothetical protein